MDCDDLKPGPALAAANDGACQANRKEGELLATLEEGAFNVFVTFPHPWPPADETLACAQRFRDGSLKLFFEASGRLKVELIDNARNILRLVRSGKLIISEITKATIFVEWGRVGLDLYIGLETRDVLKVASLLNASGIPADIDIQAIANQEYAKELARKSVN